MTEVSGEASTPDAARQEQAPAETASWQHGQDQAAQVIADLAKPVSNHLAAMNVAAQLPTAREQYGDAAS